MQLHVAESIQAPPAAQADALAALYGNTRAQGLNAEVKRRILMGTHALSAGFFDAYYKRAQQVIGLLYEWPESASVHKNAFGDAWLSAPGQQGPF